MQVSEVSAQAVGSAGSVSDVSVSVAAVDVATASEAGTGTDSEHAEPLTSTMRQLMFLLLHAYGTAGTLHWQ